MKRKNKSTFKVLKDKKVQNKERNKIRRIAKQLSNGSTVRYVLLLFEFGVIDIEELAELFSKELKKMNAKKRGGQYAYSESFLRCAAMIRAKRGLSYRELEDELKRFFPDFDIPAYTTLFTRINDKEVDILNDIVVADHFKEVILSLDASGFTQHAGGRWIEFRFEKEKDKVKKKGFVKLHPIIDVKTKAILGCTITTDSEADSSQFIELVEFALGMLQKCCNINDIEIKILADKGYDTVEIFEYCKKRGIKPIIPIRYTAKTYLETVRSKTAQIQLTFGSKCKDVTKITKKDRLKNQARWGRKNGYGERSASEGVFSTMKRLFGEGLKSILWEHMVQELLFRVAAHNLRIIKKQILANL